MKGYVTHGTNCLPIEQFYTTKLANAVAISVLPFVRELIQIRMIRELIHNFSNLNHELIQF